MGAVDCPPGLTLSGLARFEFEAKSYAKKLAWVVFVSVVVVSGATVYFIGKNFNLDKASVVLAGPLFCFMIAALGVVIRSAKLRIFEEKIQWSIPYFQFALPKEKVANVVSYTNTLAFVAQKGSSWFVTERDWKEFPRMEDAVTSCGYQVSSKKSEKTPLKAKMQSYGHVLDALLVCNLMASVGLFWYAFSASKN